MKFAKLFFACTMLLAIAAAPSHADLATYDLGWNGIGLGSSATAVGAITLDTALLPNPGTDGSLWGLAVTDFSITVSGASSGNGTWTHSDFSSWVWDTGGGALDLDSELVGQSTSLLPWGTLTGGTAGDFNVFSSTVGAPTGTFHFQLTPAGSLDTLMLTSFAPRAIPEPGICISFLVLGAIGFSQRHRFKHSK